MCYFVRVPFNSDGGYPEKVPFVKCYVNGNLSARPPLGIYPIKRGPAMGLKFVGHVEVVSTVHNIWNFVRVPFNSDVIENTNNTRINQAKLKFQFELKCK
jgi:hypothetical protein